MITKEKIKSLIENVLLVNGTLTINYLSESVIYSEQKLYNLYYGGLPNMEINRYQYLDEESSFDITNSNIDDIIDIIFNKLNDDISIYINEALDNLGLDDCDLKYFDDEPELFKKFQDEVLKLKNNN